MTHDIQAHCVFLLACSLWLLVFSSTGALLLCRFPYGTLDDKTINDQKMLRNMDHRHMDLK
jgi:hypothetical protein